MYDMVIQKKEKNQEKGKWFAVLYNALLIGLFIRNSVKCRGTQTFVTNEFLL